MGSIDTAPAPHVRLERDPDSGEQKSLAFTEARRWARCTRCHQDTEQQQAIDPDIPPSFVEWVCLDCLQKVICLP